MRQNRGVDGALTSLTGDIKTKEPASPSDQEHVARVEVADDAAKDEGRTGRAARALIEFLRQTDWQPSTAGRQPAAGGGS